jgi:hypothetical protein
MDDIIRKRVGDSKNVPDNWVKRRGKPRDPIQHSDPDFNNNNSKIHIEYRRCGFNVLKV